MSAKIFTIGHGAWTPEAMATVLRGNGVHVLIDVRSSPASKTQHMFDKTELERSMPKTGVEYLYLGRELGGRPSVPECYTDGKLDYAKTRAQEFFKTGLRHVINSVQEGLVVCLMCAEGNPVDCHRTKLVSQALVDAGFPVSHIMHDGTVKTHQAITMPLYVAQTSLL